MITIATVFPEALNLNGDQGNVLVLVDYLKRCGQEVETLAVNSAKQLLKCEPDFVFVGHGSAAAHAQIEKDLLSIGECLRSLNVPVMFVASSVEFAVEQLRLGTENIKRGERESLFSVGEVAGMRVLGYRNTDSGLPDIWLEGNFLFSMLHGPVLAKNPNLLNWLANQITQCAPLEGQHEWVGKLNEVCSRIWELETDVKFEPLR